MSPASIPTIAASCAGSLRVLVGVARPGLSVMFGHLAAIYAVELDNRDSGGRGSQAWTGPIWNLGMVGAPNLSYDSLQWLFGQDS